MKNFDPNNIKIDQKSYKNILIYHIGYATIKDWKHIKINSVTPYFQQSEWRLNGNKYLTLVPTKDSKEKIKKYEELRRVKSEI